MTGVQTCALPISSTTPQIVTLIVDDSNSMRDLVNHEKSKALIATESIQDLITTTQSNTQGATGFRFLMNIAKFGDQVTAMAQAAAPEDVDRLLLSLASEMPASKAAAEAARMSGRPKPELYRRLLELRDAGEERDV